MKVYLVNESEPYEVNSVIAGFYDEPTANQYAARMRLIKPGPDYSVSPLEIDHPSTLEWLESGVGKYSSGLDGDGDVSFVWCDDAYATPMLKPEMTRYDDGEMRIVLTAISQEAAIEMAHEIYAKENPNHA